MKFVFNNNYIRDRYTQLIDIKTFSDSVSESKYKIIRYLIGLFIAAIYAFMVGYNMYFWGQDNLRDLFIQFIIFSVLFILFIYLLQILRDVIQSFLLTRQDYEPTICIFNKFYYLSTLQYNESVSKIRILTALLTPFGLLSLLPVLLICFGITNIMLVALAYSSAVLSIPDIVQAIYISKYLVNGRSINLSTSVTNIIDTKPYTDLNNTFTKVYRNTSPSESNMDKTCSDNVKTSSNDELTIAVTDLKNSSNVVEKSSNNITEDNLSNTIIIEELKELISPLKENELAAIVKELQK